MKYRSLESLRGVAALIVALFHSVFVHGQPYPVVAQGIMFVDFFFILSGFVMAVAYSDKIRAGLEFRAFFWLRFGRLYPLHLFMLLLWLGYAVAKELVYRQWGLGGSGFGDDAGVTFFSNLLLINSLGVNDDLSWNYPAWSISVEFYTYIIFFAVVVFFSDKIKNKYYLMMSVLSYSWLYQLTDTSLLSTYQYGILRCMGGFFLGAFLLGVSRSINVLPSRWLATLIEILVVVVALYLVTLSTENKPLQLLVLGFFAVIIVVFSVQDRGAVSALLQHRYMLWLGALSYSIYMIHAIVFAVLRNICQYLLQMPVKLAVRAEQGAVEYFDTAYADLINLGCIGIIVALSALSYHVIEKPWRHKFRLLAMGKRAKINLRDY